MHRRPTAAALCFCPLLPVRRLLFKRFKIEFLSGRQSVTTFQGKAKMRKAFQALRRQFGQPNSAVRRFLAHEDGPTAVEYAVMLALIILVCFAAIKTFGTATATSFSNSATSISNAIAS